eukprot:5494199-Pyramimonas_sp.AAC.1
MDARLITRSPKPPHRPSRVRGLSRMLPRPRIRTPEGGPEKPKGGGRQAQSRSQTPTGSCKKGAQQRNRSQFDRSGRKQSKVPCYPFSRDPKNCRGPPGGCYRGRRALADAEKLERDKYEQANVVAANVASSAGGGGSRASSASLETRNKDGDKNKGRGKGKDMICRSLKETGKCTRGRECWFAQTTPNHP